jgi:hypothetical protein
MNRRALALVAFFGLAVSAGAAVDPRAHSDSASKQFSIYCEDVPLRMRVTGFTEEVKKEVLTLMDEGDLWKAPIVITIEPASPSAPEEPAARVRLLESMPGFKVAIEVKIGKDPADVNLQRQVIRALYLEYAYREKGVQGGMAFREAPWWVIEGTIQILRLRQGTADTAVYQRLIDANKLPPIAPFINDTPERLGATFEATNQALAGGLVQLLISQSGGRAGLARFIKAWPGSKDDQLTLLKREFPMLANDSTALQKLWTLNLARFAVENRQQSLSVEATDKELASLLTFDVPTGKDGTKKTFAVGDFAQYLKLPASRAALTERHTAVVNLSVRANPLFRPVLAEYEQAYALLLRGKTKGIKEKLEKVAVYRAAIVRRSSEIADYLNWFEGTQMTVRSNVFDSYLKTAEETAEQERKNSGPISSYLDKLEKEY